LLKQLWTDNQSERSIQLPGKGMYLLLITSGAQKETHKIIVP
jgi:hypothetical protein